MTNPTTPTSAPSEQAPSGAAASSLHNPWRANPDLLAALSQPAATQEAIGIYCGHRHTPEGTREFWGLADCRLEPGTKLYTHPHQPSATGGDGFFMLDDEGKAMIVNSHHYTVADIRALIEQLKAFADPLKTTQTDFDNLDWRGFCNVLWRVMMGLACDLPPASQPTSGAAGDGLAVGAERGVLVPRAAFEKAVEALAKYTQVPTDYHRAVLRLRDAMQEMVALAARPAAQQVDNAIVTSPSGSRWEVDPKWAPALQAALDGQQARQPMTGEQVGTKGGEQ